MVDIGDRVLKGQQIAEAEGFVSANVHSSVSGTVKKIEKRLVPNGSKVLSIIIENDEKYEEMPVSYTRLLLKLPLFFLLPAKALPDWLSWTWDWHYNSRR